MARQNYFEFIESMRFDAKKEIDIVKKILQEDIYIKNYKTNLQEFFSDGYKKYYPVEKKGQHVTFEEKFTVIYQRFTGVDCLYTVFEFILDLYSEIINKDKFAINYVTSKELEEIDDYSGWIPETEGEFEIWAEVRDHTSLIDQYDKLRERILYSLDKTNHEWKTLQDDNIIIVEKNVYASEVSQIVSETNIEDAIKVLEYNHFSNKGNIQRKKEILISLANYLEPLRDELNAFEELKEVMKVNGKKIIAVEQLFGMYNNLGLRHNNDKQYHLNMNDEELEQWYDDIYTSTLFVILSLDEARILSKLKNLREG
jgi:hypothetical protein